MLLKNETEWLTEGKVIHFIAWKIESPIVNRLSTQGLVASTIEVNSYEKQLDVLFHGARDS